MSRVAFARVRLFPPMVLELWLICPTMACWLQDWNTGPVTNRSSMSLGCSPVCVSDWVCRHWSYVRPRARAA